MNTLRLCRLWIVRVIIVFSVSSCYGADNTEYSHLTGNLKDHEKYDRLRLGDRQAVCSAAAVANPSLVRQLNTAAMECLSRIQTQLTLVVKGRTPLNEIATCVIESAKSDDSSLIWRKLEYANRTHKDAGNPMASGITISPNRDGIVLIINIHDIRRFMDSKFTYGSQFGEQVLVRGIELDVNYCLELGEANKDIEAPMREIIVKHLKKFCADVVKMK